MHEFLHGRAWVVKKKNGVFDGLHGKGKVIVMKQSDGLVSLDIAQLTCTLAREKKKAVLLPLECLSIFSLSIPDMG